jgi:D-sedoheptulose 7-phosphate isomerase
MLGLTHDIGDYLERFASEIDRIDRQRVYRLAELIFEVWQRRQFIFVFGNGGSGATASHFAEDLAINALPRAQLRSDAGKRPRVTSLADNTSWITALANDLAFDQIFAQQLANLAQPDDLAIAISGSGNSPNIVAAVQWANAHGLLTFGLTGFDGGKLQQLQHEGLHVDLADMGMVESTHLAILHWVVEEVHARINRVGRYRPTDRLPPVSHGGSS